MMWQPIETAPKDGSSILLATPKGRIADGFWSPVYGVWSWPYVMVEPTHWMHLPGRPSTQAQPAPSAPDGWLPVPEKHPTFDPVDLQLSDGSVLCGCVPQVDGDYWWEGPSGEVFIDPRYAPVTHWRLSAEPEAKP